MTIPELIEAASPFGQIEGDHAFLDTYLLALLAGVNPDPDELVQGTACWNCLSTAEIIAIQNYLLCLLAGTLDCTAESLALAAQEFEQIRAVFFSWLQTYAFYVWTGTFV